MELEKVATPFERPASASASLNAHLGAETLAFGGQVALVHGDGHYFKLDKPINGPRDGVLANFTASKRSAHGILTG